MCFVTWFLDNCSSWFLFLHLLNWVSAVFVLLFPVSDQLFDYCAYVSCVYDQVYYCTWIPVSCVDHDQVSGYSTWIPILYILCLWSSIWLQGSMPWIKCLQSPSAQYLWIVLMGFPERKNILCRFSSDQCFCVVAFFSVLIFFIVFSRV